MIKTNSEANNMTFPGRHNLLSTSFWWHLEPCGNSTGQARMLTII